MAEISPFPDEEGVQLERDNDTVRDLVIAALLLLSSRSPETIRSRYSNGTFPDLIKELIAEFKTNLDLTLPTLVGTANYGSRLVVDRLTTYKGSDIEVLVDEVDYILAENIEFILSSTQASIDEVQLEEPETVNVVLPFIIGLNANQAKKLINYSKASDGKSPASVVERTLSRMRDEALSYRATLISVSVTEDVLEQGKLIAANKIQIEDNVVLFKTWNTSFINSCQVCIGLHGESVPINSPFSYGIYRPKAHSNCACALTITEGES